MSDAPEGDGWWELAGKWYPPEKHPDYSPISPPATEHDLTSAQAAPSRTWFPIGAAVAGVLAGLVIVGAVVAWRSHASGGKKAPPPAAVPATHDLSGQLTVPNRCESLSDSGYSDISQGTPVVVTDQTGKTIGEGLLEAGSAPLADSFECQFDFSVSSLPRAQVYNIQVSHRGQLGYTYAQMVDNTWFVKLTLGG
jgi:hypothetical protein